ncbi:MAG: hypothetical protein UX30_C0005G0008 [Candidatus Saccharibacteria bacterium GW2011_GWA2_46_10]|nr:MAG: hypothetical protein UX30_C0005G0008 [Candidatus Saccharibacteria bacterium GW2011_GWA2_46_10]
MTDVWDWNSPIALSIFLVGLTISLALLVLTLKWLNEMAKNSHK